MLLDCNGTRALSAADLCLQRGRGQCGEPKRGVIGASPAAEGGIPELQVG